jgi:hypothetical protein
MEQRQMTDFRKASKTTETHTVSLHNGGRPEGGFVCVSTRSIKNGKPSGRTFCKVFANEALAEAYYEGL